MYEELTAHLVTYFIDSIVLEDNSQKHYSLSDSVLHVRQLTDCARLP